MATSIVPRNAQRQRRAQPARRTPARVEVVANPLRAIDPELASAAEDAVTQALARHADSRLGHVRVRFSLVRDEQGPRFVCKLEAQGEVDAGPWRWWSAIVADPIVLHDDLRSGLDRRWRRTAA